MFEHVMIDLETLGTKQTSVFVSIGACRFNPDTGEIAETFYERIDWQSAIDCGRTIDADTLTWWFNQNEEARKEIRKPGKVIKSVLSSFAKWLQATDSKVWGNGAAFDISILENAYTEIFKAIPWQFWNVRDVRTIRELAEGKVDIKDFKFEGTTHNALDDAKHQAKYVSAMWQALRK